jgi:hypothetical protein
MFNYIVITSITDTYLNHAAPGTAGINNYSLTLGNCLRLIRCINDLDRELATAIANAGLNERRDRLCLDLDEAMSNLPSLDILTNFVLVAEPDTFFEILCMNLKNDLTSFQGWLKKVENLK